MHLTSNVIWQERYKWFGGFSGAEVNTEGREITLVTDRGHLVIASMARKKDALSALRLTYHKKVLHPEGAVLKGSFVDAEGLAIAANGHAFVSFERAHRVMRLDLDTGRTTALGPQGIFDGLKFNGGLEALAIDGSGVLFTLPEAPNASGRPVPLLALRAGRWQVAAEIPREEPFLPVGADFDEKGRFYLLERAATPLGFRSRVRRFDLTVPDLAAETLLTTGPAQLDNMEAIATWRNAKGQQMMTLVSDDNFLPIQRTQIVEYRISD